MTTDLDAGPMFGSTLDTAELKAEIAQLHSALESRDVIGQAKGIIRFLTGTDSETAFTLLSRMSQDTNRKLRDVAAVISECAAAGEALPPDLRGVTG